MREPDTYAALFPPSTRPRDPNAVPGISGIFPNPAAGYDAPAGSRVDPHSLSVPAMLTADGRAAPTKYQPAGSYIDPGYQYQPPAPPPSAAPAAVPGISAVGGGAGRRQLGGGGVSEVGSSFTGSPADAAALSMAGGYGAGTVAPGTRAKGKGAAAGPVMDPASAGIMGVLSLRQGYEAGESFRKNILPNMVNAGTPPAVAANRLHYLDTLALKAAGIPLAESLPPTLSYDAKGNPVLTQAGPQNPMTTDGSGRSNLNIGNGLQSDHYMPAADVNRRNVETLASQIIHQQQKALEPQLVNIGTDSFGRPVEGVRDGNRNFSRIAAPVTKPAPDLSVHPITIGKRQFFYHADSKRYFDESGQPIVFPSGSDAAMAEAMKNLSGGAPAAASGASESAAAPASYPTLSPDQARSAKPGTLYLGTDGKLRKR